MSKPILKPPAKVPLSICLRKDQIERLKKDKAKTRVSISYMLEKLVDRHYQIKPPIK